MNLSDATGCARSPVDQPAPLVARQIQAGEAAVLSRCYRLCYDYFVKQRGWVVAENAEGEERDRYDARALHLAVFSGGLFWRANRGLSASSASRSPTRIHVGSRLFRPLKRSGAD